MQKFHVLSPELVALQRRIEDEVAKTGLDPFPVVFERVDYKQMNEIAAFGGFPVRYPHWQHGMVYEQISKSYEYGLSKIYEMVINNDPCYAYLLTANSPVENKLVMAHVYGHSDFFKHNAWFSRTNRHMIDQIANHATRVRRYIDRFGLETVESFIDRCLTLENLIDPYAVFTDKPRGPRSLSAPDDEERAQVVKFKSKPYMESFMNPREFIEQQERKIREKQEAKKKFPADPVRDVLGFLIENAPLADWQRDVVTIVRDEALYFAPQGMTKIMNEGWAVFWHTRLMARLMAPTDVIDYADRHAGTLQMSRARINPYKLGYELFCHIFDRWNKGRFGRDYDECEDMQKRRTWDTGAGAGMKKVFEVRATHNDATFIDTFLTEDFCRDAKLFAYEWNPRSERHEISTRAFDEVKGGLLKQLTNRGQPLIQVENANFENRGELLLVHRHDGVDLRMDYAQETLGNLAFLWGRPVCLMTRQQNDGKLLRHDGDRLSQRDAPYDPAWVMVN